MLCVVAETVPNEIARRGTFLLLLEQYLYLELFVVVLLLLLCLLDTLYILP